MTNSDIIIVIYLNAFDHVHYDIRPQIIVISSVLRKYFQSRLLNYCLFAG